MRRTVSLSLLAAVCAAAPASAADGAALVLDDPAGDARLLPVALHEAPGGADTRVDGGDLVSVEVSSDGGTALVVRFGLVGDPEAGPPLGYGLDAVLGGCRSSFVAFPQAAPTDGDLVRWYQSGEGCPSSSDVPGFGVWQSSPAWTVATSPTGVELRVPFDALTPEQAAVLRPGAVLAAPSADVATYAAVSVSEPASAHSRPTRLDETAVGRDWTVGEDAESG